MILRSGIGSIQNSTISQLAYWSQSVHWNFITGVHMILTRRERKLTLPIIFYVVYEPWADLIGNSWAQMVEPT